MHIKLEVRQSEDHSTGAPNQSNRLANSDRLAPMERAANGPEARRSERARLARLKRLRVGDNHDEARLEAAEEAPPSCCLDAACQRSAAARLCWPRAASQAWRCSIPTRRPEIRPPRRPLAIGTLALLVCLTIGRLGLCTGSPNGSNSSTSNGHQRHQHQVASSQVITVTNSEKGEAKLQQQQSTGECQFVLCQSSVQAPQPKGD